MDPHIAINWKLVCQALLCLYQNEGIRDQEHLTFQNEEFRITSLYHDFFNSILPLSNLTEELSNIDLELPKRYNMGRNQQSDFAFTSSMKYVMKRISQSNFLYFRKSLHKYYFKIVQDKQPLLAKTFGVYSLEDAKCKYYFIIMENLFFYQKENQLLNLFDLKGAITNRTQKDFDTLYTEQQELIKMGIYRLVKGKDQDFKKIGFFQKFTQQARKQLLEKLNQESYLLSMAQAMDYSLMIIVSVGGKTQEEQFDERMSCAGGFSITMGIIDYFQEFNSTKRFESKLKNFFSRQENQMSCVDSETYRTRFQAYFSQLI